MNRENNGMKQRYDWLDVAKGYGILLVIWAHLLDEGLNRWIYSFHMPLFFFLSGYVFHTKYEFGEFIKRKIKTLIVPYFCLGIPLALFEFGQFALKEKASLGRLIYYLGQVLVQNRYLTLWYLACLFWLNCIFYGIVKSVRRDAMLLLISVGMAAAGLVYYSLGGPSLPWNVDACLMAAPFFALGYYYKQNHEKLDEKISQGKRSVGVFLGALVCNLVFWGLTWILAGEGLEMFYNQYGIPIFTYLSAFAGIMCMVMLAKYKTLPALRYLGENSILYYAWHQTIMMPIVKAILSIWGWNVDTSDTRLEIVLYKIVSLILILAITTICDLAIKKLGLKFALGKV